jgi:hypothetical protein
MRPTLPCLLIVLAACAPKTRLDVPEEVADIDWDELSFATATVFDAGTTSGGLQKTGLVVMVSDRPDLCDVTEPGGTVDINVDVRMVLVSMIATELEPRRYTSTTKPGPGTVDGPSDVSITGFVDHYEGGEWRVHAITDPGGPRATLRIDRLSEDGGPEVGSFSFEVVQDDGNARPADFDANGDGRLNYRKLDALVEGTFADVELCEP